MKARNWKPVLDSRIQPGHQVFQCGPLRVIISKDDGRWHLSISCQTRYPGWDEIKSARYDLLPNNIYMAQILPPKEHFVNCHPNCFHLWEIPDSVVPGPDQV